VREAQAVGYTSDVAVTQQHLSEWACGDSLPNVALLDIRLPDVPVLYVTLPDFPFVEARLQGSAGE
jgi:hypothetical protein